jgi:hypothetical protein
MHLSNRQGGAAAMKQGRLKHSLPFLSLATLFSLGTLAYTQVTPAEDSQAVHSQSQAMPQDQDTRHWQVASFDEFLDQHPEVAERLRNDPSLVNNEEFVEKHPALQDYLQQHPGVREEIRENPNAFMRRERSYDRREDDRDRDRDTTRRQLASFDQFMDGHPELSEQLRQNPSLVNDGDFVRNHPALAEYLEQHPEFREEIRENPNAFMRQERRYDRREDDRDRYRDTTRRQLAGFDQFMDGHPEIAEQLRKNPALMDDGEFVKNHPALAEYLEQHPGVREEIRENPNAFMRQEQRFDHREDRREDDRDTNRRQRSGFDQFMDGHPEIAEQLRKNPSLLNDRKFVKRHHALAEYLEQHPEVREEIRENPNAFMRQEQRFDRREDRREDEHDRDVTRRQLASFDQFADSHPEIAEQIHKNPALLDDREFVKTHPALAEYLEQHPQVREEVRENPNAFMRQEQRFDRHEDRRDRDTTGVELNSFSEFLGSHASIGDQLSRDPGLANNREYMENHPEFRQYLEAHPAVREELKENPQVFMRSVQQLKTGGRGYTGASPDSKPKQ